jgi:hypothetical protein
MLLAAAFAAVLATAANAEMLQTLPKQVQKEINETRAACRDMGMRDDAIYDDVGLTSFILLGGINAVIVDNGEICGGERMKGANCATGGCVVMVYVRARGSWKKVLTARNHFISADWTKEQTELRLMVVSLYGDAPECPVRAANLRAYGPTAWKHGMCDVVARWDGNKFVYTMLQ